VKTSNCRQKLAGIVLNKTPCRNSRRTETKPRVKKTTRRLKAFGNILVPSNYNEIKTRRAVFSVRRK